MPFHPQLDDDIVEFMLMHLVCFSIPDIALVFY